MRAPGEAIKLLLSRNGRGKLPQTGHATHPEKWLFLDVEATGFIGGAGNVAFMIGLAWWDSGGIQIEQLFMRDPAEEHSILLELSRRLRKRPVLVTFNGKSFDWPLLVRRFHMTRSIAPPLPRIHLDFLHPARELWKLQIGRVKLGHLEKHVLNAEYLGWSRREDIDSAHIPGIYFDYVCGRRSQIDAVFRHNRMDLRGLAALAVRILRMLSPNHGPAAAEQHHPLELYSLSRFFARRGQYANARKYCQAALDAGLPAAIEAQAQQQLAKLRYLEEKRAGAVGRKRSAVPRAAFNTQMSRSEAKQTSA